MLTIGFRFCLIFISLTLCAGNLFAGTSNETAEKASAFVASADSATPDSVNIETDSVPADITDQPSTIPPSDPLENFNRMMFKFNDFFDNYILKPVSELYIKIIPKPLQKGISNAFNNIDTVPTILNDLLMANFYQATIDTWRLGINTTVGLGGFFDVSSQMGLESNTEDFGLTLARWGWTHSTYIVIPFLGPSTLRDGLIGWPVNYNFLSVYPYIHPLRLQYGIYGVNVISRRADLLHYQEVMDSVAIDKYIFMRDAYLQRRNYLIDRNKELNDPYIAKNNIDTPTEINHETQAVEQTKPFSNI